MADVETSTTWANLLREMKGPLVEALRWKTVLLSEVKRDGNARRWAGKQITIPIILAPQQGTGTIGGQMLAGIGQTAPPSEIGTLNLPHNIDDTQANIKTAIVTHAVSFSTQVIQQAKVDDTSWAQVLPTKMRMAEDAIGRFMNEEMCGGGPSAGDVGKLTDIASGTTGTLVITVPATANFYQLYPGRIVDIRTKATGVLTTGGASRKIASVNRTTGAITFSSAGFGGDSGSSITFSTSEGIYVEGGGYWNAGGANQAQPSNNYGLQGLGSAVATTGIFEGIDKSSVSQWQGTDASPGVATDPGLSTFDRAERLAAINSGTPPDFYLCDPAVIDKFSQGLTTSARWAGDAGTLETGWTGVRYRNKLLVPEFDMPASTAYGISREDCALYTLDAGPDWDNQTGSMFQRFAARTLPVEAWLVWMVQFGFTRCNSFVKVGNLNQAP